MKILLIKTSSLGDVIHALPALTDALRAVPELKVDWVVEERFADIPSWHPAVNKIIPVAIRRWRKKLYKKQTWREIKTAISVLRKEKYDLIIDAQGLMKAVWISWFVKAKTCGYAFGCARDSVAPLFYNKKFKLTLEDHAVERIRKLFSGALNYHLPNSLPDKLPNYGVDKTRWQKSELINENYILFFHGTTWKNKHWPENYWASLINLLDKKNYKVKLSWGSEQEKLNSLKIVELSQVQNKVENKNVSLLPDLNVAGLLPYIASARAVVAVDTGLCHLAAALNIPTVALFGPTDPSKTGVTGPQQITLKTNFDCSPCLRRECDFKQKTQEWPACFESLKPELVLEKLLSLLEGVTNV